MAQLKTFLWFVGKVYVAQLVAQALFKFLPIPDNIRAIILDPIGSLFKK